MDYKGSEKEGRRMFFKNRVFNISSPGLLEKPYFIHRKFSTGSSI